jgi:hypothetical protein
MNNSHRIDALLLAIAISLTVAIAPGLAQSNDPPSAPAEDAPLPTTIPPVPQRSYIGIGPAFGLSGSSTSLSTGGLAVFLKQVLSDNLSIRNSNVVFASRAPSSTLVLTVDFPIRNEDSGDIVFSPFLGGGAAIRNEEGTIYVSPHATVGVDLPLPVGGVTGVLQVDMAFPSNRAADVGLLLGVGLSF